MMVWQCPRKPEEGIRFPGAGVTGDWKLPCVLGTELGSYARAASGLNQPALLSFLLISLEGVLALVGCVLNCPCLPCLFLPPPPPHCHTSLKSWEPPQLVRVVTEDMDHLEHGSLVKG